MTSVQHHLITLITLSLFLFMISTMRVADKMWEGSGSWPYGYAWNLWSVRLLLAINATAISTAFSTVFECLLKNVNAAPLTVTLISISLICINSISTLRISIIDMFPDTWCFADVTRKDDNCKALQLEGRGPIYSKFGEELEFLHTSLRFETGAPQMSMTSWWLIDLHLKMGENNTYN